ncbi:MAG: thioredoxin-dependent thiol peroxidase [Bacteroidota bacterium]
MPKLELLEAGADAPEFTVKNQAGEDVSLTDFRGQKVILYFYPKDNTPGCTKEACNLRDNHAVLTEQGFVVLGVSVDSEASHQKFIKKYDLPFALLADTEHDIVNKYKVWGEKSMYGRKYEGTYRVTYVIDENGKIEHVIPKVKAGEHTAQVLALYN